MTTYWLIREFTEEERRDSKVPVDLLSKDGEEEKNKSPEKNVTIKEEKADVTPTQFSSSPPPYELLNPLKPPSPPPTAHLLSHDDSCAIEMNSFQHSKNMCNNNNKKPVS